jgi:xylulokinase
MLQSESGCLGAAMLAGLGAGAFATPAQAVAAMVKPGSTFVPENELAAAGAKIFAKYKKFYQQLKPLFKEK